MSGHWLRRFGLFAFLCLIALLSLGATPGDAVSSGIVPFSSTPVTVGATRTFPKGSLIIPMDTTYQDKGIILAYGLLYKLLLSDIPVHWVIKKGKKRGDADFTVAAKDLQSGKSIASHGYRGGPFVVDASLAAKAKPIMQAWQSANGDTVVHESAASFQGRTGRYLTAAPSIAVIADKNEKIAFKYLNAAKIPDSKGQTWPAKDAANYPNHPDVLTIPQIAGPSKTIHNDGALFRKSGQPAYCQVMTMHWDVKDAAKVPEVVAEYRSFLKFPTHVFSHCQGVNAVENNVNGRFLTPKGFLIDNKLSGSLLFLNLDTPFAQMDGPFEVVGGSERAYSLPKGDSYKTRNVVMITDKVGGTGTRDVWMTGYLDGKCTVDEDDLGCTAGVGKVSYLGGHAYDTKVPLSKNPKTQGTRLFLNSLFEASCATDEGQPKVHLIKQGPVRTSQSQVTYSLFYANHGAGPALGVTLTDTLPAGSTYVSSTGGGVHSAGVVTWNVGDLARSQTGSVQVTIRLPRFGSYQNKFDASYTVGVNRRRATSNLVSTVYDRVPVTEPPTGADGGTVPDVPMPPDVVAPDAPPTATCLPPNMLVLLDRSGSMKFATHSLCPQGDCTVATTKACTQPNECTPMPRTHQPAPGTTPRYPNLCTAGKCRYTRWDVAQNVIKEVAFQFGGQAPNFTKPKLSFGLISFNNQASVNAPLPSKPPQVQSALNQAEAGGGTSYTSAFLEAHKQLLSSLSKTPGQAPPTFILFLTDGKPNEGCASSVQIVRSLRQGTGAYRLQTPDGTIHQIRTYVIGFGSSLDSTARSCLNQLAAAGGTQRCSPNVPGCVAYFFADNESQLKQALNAITSTNTQEVCDGVDNDCDGIVDEGCQKPDCRDGEKRNCTSQCGPGSQVCVGGKWGTCTTPSQAEVCDGVDNDCDGLVDEQLSRPCRTACGTGVEVCTKGQWAACTAPQPGKEVCDQVDNDCDGSIDEGCGCQSGQARACYTGPAATRNKGECRDGTQRCVGGQWESGCRGEVKPDTTAPEKCDGLDNNCDGTIDEGCKPTCQDGEKRNCPTECGSGQQTCKSGQWGVCKGVTRANVELCNGKDDDCDGKIDEHLLRACKTACGTGLDRCIRAKWTGCQGRQPAREVCDGIDNDCDGKTDEEATCPNGGKCSDGACLRPCRNGECPKGQICTDGTCYPSVSCSAVKCSKGEFCRLGKCQSVCDALQCPSGFVCWLGACVPPDCYSLGCPSGKACVTGVCVDNPCANLRCSGGDICKDGKCIKSCSKVTCPAKQSCRDGRCSPDLCAGVTCQQGEVCFHGACVPDPCKQIECPTGRVCTLGECIDDPCATMRCPGSLSCQKGRCVDLCKDKTCDAGKACRAGECLPDNCYFQGCATDEICQNGVCVEDPCAKARCSKDAYCKAGRCLPSCHRVKCKAGEQCKDGACVKDLCFQVTCPSGETCIKGVCQEDLCRSVNCDKGTICAPETGSCVDEPCLSVRCPTGAVCRSGQCVDPCGDVKCPADFVCEQGVCVAQDCYTKPCPGAQICVSKQCVEDPCKAKKCAGNQFCRQGSCVKSCAGVSCRGGERCEDGQCVADPCAGVTCAAGEFCAKGSCKKDPCREVFCGVGRECNPNSGACEDDPCLHIKCPSEQACYRGQCVGKSDIPKPGENTTGQGETPLPPTSKESGNANDAATPEKGSSPSGCGCSGTPEGPLQWLLLCLLLVFVTRNGRSVAES